MIGAILGDMAGGIAEAYYGMPELLKEECLDILPKELRRIVVQFETFEH